MSIYYQYLQYVWHAIYYEVFILTYSSLNTMLVLYLCKVQNKVTKRISASLFSGGERKIGGPTK